MKHLENGPEDARTETVANVWRLMQRIDESGKQVIIDWVTGHAGLEGNEKVYKIAKEATREDQRSAKVPQGAAESTIYRHCTEEWIKEVHQRAAHNPSSTLNWYLSITNWKPRRLLQGKLTRKESRLIEQLRMGRSLVLARTRCEMKIEDSPICPNWLEGEETAEHLLLSCPKWTKYRVDIFGINPTPQQVFNDKIGLLKFLRRVGVIAANID